MLKKITKMQFYSLILIIFCFGIGSGFFYLDVNRKKTDLNDKSVEIRLNEKGWTRNDIELTVSYHGSPIFIKGYSFDGGETWSRSNMLRVSSNKTINIQVMDVNDRIYKIDYEVANIDREGPVVLIDKDIKVTRGTKVDLNNYVTVVDKKSGVRDEIVFTPATVDTTKLGTQTIQIYAIDNLANKTITKMDVEVVNTPVAVSAKSITLDHTVLNLKVKEENILVATISPKSATNKKITWYSENDSIADVDMAGKVTGVSSGTTNIVAMTSNGIKASCKVVVK